MSALKGVYVTPDVKQLSKLSSGDIFPLKVIHSTRAMFRLESDTPEGAVQYVIQTNNKLTIGAIYVDFTGQGAAYEQAIKQGLDLATVQLATMGAV